MNGRASVSNSRFVQVIDSAFSIRTAYEEFLHDFFDDESGNFVARILFRQLVLANSNGYSVSRVTNELMKFEFDFFEGHDFSISSPVATLVLTVIFVSQHGHV